MLHRNTLSEKLSLCHLQLIWYNKQDQLLEGINVNHFKMCQYEPMPLGYNSLIFIDNGSLKANCSIPNKYIENISP